MTDVVIELQPPQEVVVSVGQPSGPEITPWSFYEPFQASVTTDGSPIDYGAGGFAEMRFTMVGSTCMGNFWIKLGVGSSLGLANILMPLPRGIASAGRSSLLQPVGHCTLIKGTPISAIGGIHAMITGGDLNEVLSLPPGSIPSNYVTLDYSAGSDEQIQVVSQTMPWDWSAGGYIKGAFMYEAE